MMMMMMMVKKMFTCNAAKLLLPFVVVKIYTTKRETQES